MHSVVRMEGGKKLVAWVRLPFFTVYTVACDP